jgi:LysM repeat protein
MKFFLLIFFVTNLYYLPFVAAARPCFENEWWWQEADKIDAYVEKYKHIAIAEMDRSNIPASIKIAQGILESGSGESELATVANNHFGIKCGGDWPGLSHYVWDDEPQKSCFRVYASPEESYIAHSEFLHNPIKEFRYGFLFKLDKTDYKAWAKGLQSSGYATSKTYAEKLISLIERYQLYKLDHLTLQTIALTEAEIAHIFDLQKHASDTVAVEPADTLLVVTDPFLDTDTTGENTTDVWVEFHALQHTDLTTDKVFYVNKLPVVVARKDETLSGIAKRTGIKAKKLEKYNELKKRKLIAGQYIFLEAKAKKSNSSLSRHIVRYGQTLYDIAQYHGLQLRTLTKLNPKLKKIELQTGMQLLLK